jgi:tetratricopeptide (TPR) repeat protein
MQQAKEEGNEAFKRGDHEESIRLYSKAIELCDDKSVLHLIFCNRAAALLALERFEEALADCEQVIQLDPKFIKGYLRKTMALRAMGRKKEALEVAKLGLSIDRNPKSVAVPELTKLAHAINAELKPNMVGTKRTPEETREIVNDYRQVASEVDQIGQELEVRQRDFRSLSLTLEYVNRVNENSTQIPNTFVPMGRMFIKKPVDIVKKELAETIDETTKEFEALKEKMNTRQGRLQNLSEELGELMRQQGS